MAETMTFAHAMISFADTVREISQAAPGKQSFRIGSSGPKLVVEIDDQDPLSKIRAVDAWTALCTEYLEELAGQKIHNDLFQAVHFSKFSL